MSTEPTDKWARNERGRFGPGNSGGPGGSRSRSDYRKAMEAALSPDHVAAVCRQMTAKGLQGNVQAAQLVLSHTLGKPSEAPAAPEVVPVDLRSLDTIDACGSAIEKVVAGITNAQVTTKTGKALLDGINSRVLTLQAAQKEREAFPNQAPTRPPIPANVLRGWFVRFKKTGVLPTDPREAVAVVTKVKAGFEVVEAEPGQPTTAWFDGFKPKVRAESLMMDAILMEAAVDTDLGGDIARGLLCNMARIGIDVTASQHEFLKPPKYGSAALDFIGFPEQFVRRPFVAQAKRLFKRLAAARDKVPRDRQAAREWVARVDQFVTCFQMEGQLPEDPLILEVVLITGELHTLIDHIAGEKVGDVLKLFDVAARGDAPARERAIHRLQEMAKAGRFWGRACSKAG